MESRTPKMADVYVSPEKPHTLLSPLCLWHVCSSSWCERLSPLPLVTLWWKVPHPRQLPLGLRRWEWKAWGPQRARETERKGLEGDRPNLFLSPSSGDLDPESTGRFTLHLPWQRFYGKDRIWIEPSRTETLEDSKDGSGDSGNDSKKDTEETKDIWS